VKVLIDTNIFLDISLHREPFSSESEKLLLSPEVEFFTAWHSIATIWYLLRNTQSGLGPGKALDVIRAIAISTTVATCGAPELNKALSLPMTDFEDAMLSAIADSHQLDYIATRNLKDFSSSPVPAILPVDLCSILAEE